MHIQIKKKYKDFCLDIDKSETSKRIGVLGASGCGKSMLLKSIAGIVTVDEGRVEINRRVLYDSKKKMDLTPQARRVGYLFQNYALFPNMTIEENIGVGVFKDKQERKEIVRDAIEKFKLSGLEKRFPSQLSGGQQQRVALARIMVYRPDVILLDEPFSAMDSYLKLSLQEELREMTADYDGIMMMVSHSRDEIYYFADTVWIMNEGKLICGGDKESIFHSPQNIIAARMTGCKNIFEVEILDEHHILVKDFDSVLEFQQKLSKDIKAIGYRAHDFIPIWDEKEENCVPVQVASEVVLPFETNYYIFSKSEKRLVWMVQREGKREVENRGYPDFLKMEEERILLLS